MILGSQPTLEDLFNQSKASLKKTSPTSSIKSTGSVNRSGKPAPAIAKKPGAPVLTGRGQVTITTPHRAAPLPPQHEHSSTPPIKKLASGDGSVDDLTWKKRESMSKATSNSTEEYDSVTDEIEPVRLYDYTS